MSSAAELLKLNSENSAKESKASARNSAFKFMSSREEYTNQNLDSKRIGSMKIPINSLECS